MILLYVIYRTYIDMQGLITKSKRQRLQFFLSLCRMGRTAS